MTPLEYQGAFYAYSQTASGFLASVVAFQCKRFGMWWPVRASQSSCLVIGSLCKSAVVLGCSLPRRGKHALPSALGLSRHQRQSEAVRRISSMPLAHLSVSITCLRFWTFTDRGWLSILINACAFGSLLLAPFVAIVQKRLVWLIVCITPFAYFLFYASLSLYPALFGAMIPIALITLGCLLLIEFRP